MRLLLAAGFILLGQSIGLTAEVKHPVYPPTASQASVPSLESGVKELMAMSDQELRDFVPKLNGFLFCGCPNCKMGTQEGQISWKGIKDPAKAYCRYCGCEYPNPKYPENQTITGVNFKGETVTYHYYEDPEGGRHYFTGRISYDKKHWLAGRANELAQLYAVTKAPEYAHKAVVLLDALADAYSHWCVHHDLCFGEKAPVAPRPPYPYWGGIWDRWYYADVPVTAILGYDQVATSGEVEKLSAALGVDVRKRIEDGFFRFSVEFVKTYKEMLSNMSPGIYEGLIVTGRVLGEPDYVHDGVGRFRELLSSKFFFDGFWQEGSISYHDQSIHWLKQVADRALGYSDPEGYTSPRDNMRYQSLDLMAAFPLARTALDMDKRFVYPDGHIIPCHDAWANASQGALERSSPWLLPAMGHAILGLGEGKQQAQAQLHFSGGYGHQHADNLHFSFFALGHELAPDLGYTHTKYRAWSICTPAHNTVAIDEADQNASGHTCNLLLWAPNAGPAQVVEAEAKASYPNKAQEFRRMVALVKVDEAHAYAVDIFRLKGGKQHDYFLHSNADADQTVECSLPTAPLAGSLLGPGVDFALPSVGETDHGRAPQGRNIAYGFIQNLRAGTTSDACEARFRFKSGSPVVYAVTLLGQPDQQIVLGEAPSIRRAVDNDQELDKYKMPVLVARRRGEALQSAFVAVHRAYEGDDFIRSVKPLPGVLPAEGVTALVVEHSLGRDVIFACTEAGAASGVRIAGREAPLCDGRFGLVRYDLNGKPVGAALVGGKTLSGDNVAIQAEGPVSGRLVGVRKAPEGFALEVPEKLPAGTALAGCTILVRHADGATHGYTIRSASATPTGSLVAIEGDPGFAIEGNKTRFLYFPQGELEGENTYRIENVVVVAQGAGGH